MVTGFEVYGAIGTSIALLNLARQGYASLAKTHGNYRKAGPHIVEAQRHCSNLYFIIQGWSTRLGFHIPMTDDLYKAHWGEDGWKLIKTQLVAVSVKCEDLAAVMAKALPPTETYDQIPEDDRKRARACLEKRAPPARHIDPSSSSLLERMREALGWKIRKRDTNQEIEKIRVLEEYITKSTSAWKKVKYVLSSSENLQKHLNALEKEFDELKRLVKTAWVLQHPEIDYTTSTLSERLLAAFGKALQFSLQEAKEDRLATKALYGSCSSIKQALKLEMSLLDTKGDSRSKRFHIFVPRVQFKGCLEVSTVILRNDPPSGDVDRRDTFLGTCDKVCQKGEDLLWASSNNHNSSAWSPEESRKKIWFSLRKQAIHVGKMNLTRLSVELASLVAAERLELAYSVVETGLILFGTSWFSALSSTALKRFKANQQPPRYILDIDGKNKMVHSGVGDHKRDLHLYTFTIGIALVEIALQTMVQSFRRSRSGLELRIGGSDGLKWRSSSHVTSLVAEKLGAAYSEAVEFCLQDPLLAPNCRWHRGLLYDSTRSEEQKSIELLDLFYQNVLIK